MTFKLICLGVASAAVAAAHGDHTQEPIAGPHKSLWYNSLPGDGGTQVTHWPMRIGGVSILDSITELDYRPILCFLESQLLGGCHIFRV